MLIWFIRALFIVIIAGTAGRVSQEYSSLLISGSWGSIIVFCGILGAGLVAVALDIYYREKQISTISAVYFGLLVGSLLGHLLNLAFGPTLWQFSNEQLSRPFSLVTTTILCYMCVSFLLQTKNDFRFVIPYVEFSRQLKGARPMILDTSVIIDGRIAELAETGLLDQTLVIPRFVLRELHAIADSQEKHRKLRGRNGLNVIDRLRKCRHVEVDLQSGIDTVPPGKREVDNELINISREMSGRLVTNDINLAKLARLQNIETINLNEISRAARAPVQYGDSFSVRIVREGEEAGQGVGYLDDGTMVVAELGKNHLGQDVHVVVTSVLQTNAGRIVFGRIDGRVNEPNKVTGSRA